MSTLGALAVDDRSRRARLASFALAGLDIQPIPPTQQLCGSALKLTQDDPAIQKGVQYVVNNAAEAIKHFKIPTDRIAQKLEAKVGLKAIETNLAATASPVPGVTSPLAPVPAVHSEA